MVAAGTPDPVQIGQRRASACRTRRRRRRCPGRTGCPPPGAARPFRRTGFWRTAGPRRVPPLGEVLVRPVPPGEPDQREARRQQPAVGQVVDRRHQLLAGQVAGHPEDDDPGRDRRSAAAACPADRAAGLVVTGIGRSLMLPVGDGRSSSGRRSTVLDAARSRTPRTCRRPRSPARRRRRRGRCRRRSRSANTCGRLSVAAGDGVAADHAVVGDGVDGLLRCGVHRAAGRPARRRNGCRRRPGP